MNGLQPLSCRLPASALILLAFAERKRPKYSGMCVVVPQRSPKKCTCRRRPLAPSCPLSPATRHFPVHQGIACSSGAALLHSETPSPPIECRPHENASPSLVAQLLPLPSWGFRRRLSRTRRSVPGTRLGNRRDVHASPEEHAGVNTSSRNWSSATPMA